jgi:hypothetical protein
LKTNHLATLLKSPTFVKKFSRQDKTATTQATNGDETKISQVAISS